MRCRVPTTGKGQISMIGLIAVAIAIIVIVFSMLKGREVEHRIAIKETDAISLKETMENLHTAVEARLRTAVYDAVWDMATHGGYAPGNVPALNHVSVPYWFYRGRVVNVPTVEVMEEMLARDIERRMLNALEHHRSKPGVDIGMPRVTADLTDNDVKVTMALAVKALGADESDATSDEEFQIVLPLRIKTLRDQAEVYVEEYKGTRMVEKALLTSLIQDYRIPTPPGGEAAKNIDCDNPPSKHRNELIYPFRENAKLAVARELRRVRAKKAVNIHWNAVLNDRDVNFTLLANEGRKEYESTKEVRYIPRPLLPFSVEKKTCSSFYFVRYNVTFPVMISVTDLAPTSNVVSQESRPLSFWFQLGVFLKGDEPTAELSEAEVGAPAKVDGLCQGSCSVDLSIKGSSSGLVCIGSCCDQYEGGEFSKDQVQCKVHDLVITPDEPGLARWSERVNIGRSFSKEVEVEMFSSIEGTVSEQGRVLCEGSARVEERELMPLGFVDGNPPRFVELFFAPLDRNLGEVRHATTNEYGHYEVSAINPGPYVVLAVPSADAERIPGYKVEANATIIEVKTGKNTHQVVLEPLGVEKVGERFVRVSGREPCS
ncbi:MAG: carboxypeptidase-like regulatory domain-containing protein [Candidatus Undinarchaeales archaeon]|nr:carboxypeptidase-like regulatory domain-containing protein [Candidatus Undinarchaeales archaeon]MDP7491465.1 carboxypeptidase-like regulatory domain-containing protein [Candidatus Undinarchaeales archaeon]